jgi:ribonuclease P protein component
VAPGLILQALRRDSGSEQRPRIGFTASKKVGNAIIRNRARRRLRAAVRQVMPVHAAAAHDFVVIARSTTALRPWPLLIEDLEGALKRVGAWRERSATGHERSTTDGPAA